MVANLAEPPPLSSPGTPAGSASVDGVATGGRSLTAPKFYLTGRQPLRPGVVLLAAVTASAGLSTILYALNRSHAHGKMGDPSATRFSATSAAPSAADEKDDPSQVDTIVLGDPADAPVPARRGERVSNVHATILIRLPRFGEQVGLIPDTPAGHLLYRWLAAFNQGSDPALADVLPNAAARTAAAAQIKLRQQTGGFNLLSAREVQPGILVFRLRDQTPEAVETLGTLQVRPNSNPPVIASFSLRAIQTAHL